VVRLSKGSLSVKICRERGRDALQGRDPLTPARDPLGRKAGVTCEALLPAAIYSKEELVGDVQGTYQEGVTLCAFIDHKQDGVMPTAGSPKIAL